MADKDITLHKVEAPEADEQTKTGLVFIPAVDIYESSTALTLIADLPGVKSDAVEIDLKDGILSLSAEAEEGMGPEEQPLSAEYRSGRYFRRFTLSDLIDQTKIEAKMKDGVLELILPKVEKAQPRKIQVKGS